MKLFTHLKKRWWWLLLAAFMVGGSGTLRADENHLEQYMMVDWHNVDGKFMVRFASNHMRKGGAYNLPSRINYINIKVNGTTYYRIQDASVGACWDCDKSFTYVNYSYNDLSRGKFFVSGKDGFWSNYNTYSQSVTLYGNSGWYSQVHWYIPNDMTDKDIKIELEYSYYYNYMDWTTERVQTYTGTKSWTIKASSTMHDIKLTSHSINKNDNQIVLNWNIPNFNASREQDGSAKLCVEKRRSGSSNWSVVQEDTGYSNTSSSGEIKVDLNKLSADDINTGFYLRVVRKKAPGTEHGIPEFRKNSEETSMYKYSTLTGSLGLENLGTGEVKLTWNTQTSASGETFRIQRATNSAFTANLKEQNYTASGSTSHTFTDKFDDRDKNNITYYYRVTKDPFGKWESTFYKSNSININTNYTKIGVVTVTPGTNKADIKWTIQDGIWESGFKYVILSNSSSLTTITNKNTLTYTDNSIQNCISTVYQIQIQNNLGSVINSYKHTPIVIQDPAAKPSLEDIKVSKGIYSNYVSIEWKAKKDNNLDLFKRYIISRKVLTTTNEETTPIQLAIVEHQSGITDYRYDDNTALPGTYYSYTISGQAECNGKMSTVDGKNSVGFMQPFGIVSGRISYQDGTTAVQGVNVLVNGEGDMQNKTMDFSATQKTYTLTPYKEGTLSPYDFTFQAWVKVREMVQGQEATNSQAFTTAWGKYNTMIHTTGQLGIEYFNTTASGKRTAVYFNERLPVKNEFTHVTMTYHADTTAKKIEVKLYINGELKETQSPVYPANGIGFVPTDPGFNTNAIFTGRGGSLDWFFNGYMDELRLWKKTLTSEEIKQNYNRYLSGGEDGLSLYYRFDELLGDEVYDMSGKTGKYNENHGKIESGNTSRSTTNIPTANQLSIKGVTDKNGHYIINTIPYTADGSSYTIVPQLGVHQFSPSEKPLFFSRNSSTMNDVNFSDISSFKVSGKVYYEGGDYPVEGCNFEVDGKILVDRSGLPIASKKDGTYEIQVPIGQHELKIVKTGHTFVNNGLALENGENIVFNDEVSGLNFKDKTRVKLVGHIVGGKIEHNKVSGFAETKNNIGADSLVLVAVKEQDGYSLSSQKVSGVTTSVRYDTIFYHNNGEWKKDGILQQDSTEMTVKGNNITIHVSPATGEFVAWVYPEAYTIQDINVVNNNAINPIYNKKELLDLSKTPVSNPDMLQKSIRTWVDSVFVKGTGNQKDHKIAVEHSDTITFNKEWKYYYQAKPQYSVQQMKGKQVISSLGDEIYQQENSITGEKNDITLFTDNGNGTYQYVFDNPVFCQAKSYNFALKAYEEYINNRLSPVQTDVVPVQGGLAKITNTIALTPPEPIELDSIGEAVYTFTAGAPDLTNGIKSLSSVVEIDGIGYGWNRNESEIRAYVLGSKTTGTDFMTAGPDKITAVVHDPPGSLSYAYLEKGTTITKTQSLSATGGITLEAGTEIDLGAKVTTFVGLGAGVITDTEVIAEVDAGVETSTSFKYGNETEEVTTFTERFETSDDPLYVGHAGDVFVGNSTNIQYGLTNSISILKASQVIDPAENIIYPENGYADDDFVIAKSQGLAFGQTFGTRFAYTEVELEQIMIPKWQNTLKLLLLPIPPEEVDVNTIPRPVYCTNLPGTDNNFGKKNTDKDAFGASAVTSDKYHDGPSYTTVFPAGYLESEAMKSYVDSIIYYNNQIERWTEVLANNEKEKVEMRLIGNYSFGSGGKIEYSNTRSATKTDSYDFSFVISPSVGLRAGTEICGIEMVVNAKTTTSIGTDDSWSEGPEESKTVGFVLQEEGYGDQISVDYVWTESGTIAFKSRGGRTSCPHEAEVRTKHYQPGQHILSEGTMQMEVPVLTVKGGAYALKVPSNRPASFMLELKNESETKDDMWFKLLVDESTNPSGAELKIDGIGIGNGRSFLVPAGGILEKTLTIQKGPNVDKYDNIRLLLVSQCQYDPTDYVKDIFGETTISVEFIPSCSDVTIKLPMDKWTVNTITGDSMKVILEGFDVNYSNFGHVDLQYKPTSSSEWSSLMAFYANENRYNDASTTLKTLLGTDPDIIYMWYMDNVKDGTYDLRARTICESATTGQLISEYNTPAVTGVKDMICPVEFGKPTPLNAILSGTDNIMIQFNEDINQGLVNNTNFTITGVKNGSQDSHFTSVHFDGAVSSMATEQEINLESKSFTVEFWMKRDQLGAATIFNHGNSKEAFTIGFTSDNHLQVTVGNTTITSDKISNNTSEWGHWAITYNAEKSTVSAYYAAGSFNDVLMDEKPAGAYHSTGIVQLGASFNQTNFFAGNIHGLRIWDRTLAVTKISADMNKILSGNEIGLIGYWPMNEGKGTLAQDKASYRHATLNAAWKILPEGKALSFSGVDSYLDINTGSSVVITQEKDFSIEMWFKGEQDNGALFSCGRGDGVDMDTNNKLSIYFEGGLLKLASNGTIYELSNTNYLDNKWHHLAISVKRSGSANMYVDGNLVNYTDGIRIGSLAAANMVIGCRQWKEDYLTTKTDMYFKGMIDEVRFWNMAISEEFISHNNNVRLSGKEVGLIAYYPFDTYIVNDNDRKELAFSLADQVTGATIPSAVANNAVQTDEKAPIKDAGPVSEYAFNFVTSKDKIILNLTDNIDAIERTLITITASGIQDLNGNKMLSPVNWMAYIDRAFLKWESESITKTKPVNEAYTFTVKLINTGGNVERFNIENIPSWLEITPNNGSVAPASNVDLTFTVHEGLNIGTYDEMLYLKGTYTTPLSFNLRVEGGKPDWSVNPSKYASSMSVFGQLKVNGIISKDKDDMVAAFVNNECVGLAKPQYNKTYDMYLVFLTIYGNTNDKPVEFRVWDASTGNTYSNAKPTDVTFKGNVILGSPLEPVMFETTNTNMQVIPVYAGWNWISFNVQSPALSNVNQSLQSLLAVSNGDEIKGQKSGEFSRYNNNTWTNANLGGSGFQNTQMYMLKTVNNGSLSISGTPLEPKDITISLKSGWNWISYIPQTNITVSEALSGLTPAKNDIIKSMTEFAVYNDRAGWIGSLQYLRPNAGYMYKAENEGSFMYPSSTSLRSNAKQRQKDNEISELSMTNAYEYNLSLIGEVQTGGSLPANSKLKAKVNGEVRGIAEGIAVEGYDEPLFFLTVSASEQEPISFSIENNGEEKELKERVFFTQNDVVGSLEQPMLFSLNDKESCNVYPNPFIDKLYVEYWAEAGNITQISMYDLVGNQVYITEKTAMHSGLQQMVIYEREILGAAPGIYNIRIVTNNSAETFKLVKQ